MMPPAQYYASLPKQIAGAGAIFHDEHGRILLVKPSYHEAGTWEIPGGGLDAGEDPWAAAQREVKEELGISLSAGRLLVIDWVPERADGRPALANFVFDGGTITQQVAEASLHLDPTELTDWQLAAPEQWEALLAPHMVRRLHACSRALAGHTTLYLHHGWEPTRSAS